MSRFDDCMEVTLKWEGGFVDHPRDPGGATNMGITHLTLSSWRGHKVTKAEVLALTKSEARDIYRARYWLAVKANELPPGLDLVAFDGAVNSGPQRGAEWLQEALGVTADGVIGPNTIAAAAAADVPAAINRAMDLRLGFLRRLNTWNTFGKGWGNRLADVRAHALRMAGPSQRQATKTAGAGWLAGLRPALWRLLTGGKA